MYKILSGYLYLIILVLHIWSHCAFQTYLNYLLQCRNYSLQCVTSSLVIRKGEGDLPTIKINLNGFSLSNYKITVWLLFTCTIIAAFKTLNNCAICVVSSYILSTLEFVINTTLLIVQTLWRYSLLDPCGSWHDTTFA